jgi:hypothetical protein
VTSVPDMLKTYLQDHHAGATVGVELARRAAGSNSDNDYGSELEAIADEIAADRESLERVMEVLDVKPSTIKDAAGWTAEKFGRLKPNNSLLSYSPLSRVVELEGLMLGVTGKLALWEALRTVLGDRLEDVDLGTLADRALDQRARLKEMRLEAVAEAFATDQSESANARRASPGSA